MVIQRWQSVLLLIAAVMMGFFSANSLGQFQLTDYTLDFLPWGIFSEGSPTDGASTVYIPTPYVVIISALSAILFFIDIFLFRNLSLQKKVCAVSVLITIASMITVAIIGYSAIDNATVSWSSMTITPFVALASGFLAIRFISSDQTKLKSIDRIR